MSERLVEDELEESYEGLMYASIDFIDFLKNIGESSRSISESHDPYGLLEELSVFKRFALETFPRETPDDAKALGTIILLSIPIVASYLKHNVIELPTIQDLTIKAKILHADEILTERSA